MYYPQSDRISTKSDGSFEIDVIARLERLEQRLDRLTGYAELVQEMIKNQLRNVSIEGGSRTTTGEDASTHGKASSGSYFRVTLVGEPPACFRVGGKTYDIRDTLKAMAPATFKKEHRAWEYCYTEELFERIVAYLKTMTDDVSVTKEA